MKSIKVLHVFSWTAWMAGMFYLPRIFVYHSGVHTGSESDAIFKTMERKLYRYIMTPAMLATLVTGMALIYLDEAWGKPWLHLKSVGVCAMIATHLTLGHYKNKMAQGVISGNRKFRMLNEVPTVLLLFILCMVFLKPLS